LKDMVVFVVGFGRLKVVFVCRGLDQSPPGLEHTCRINCSRYRTALPIAYTRDAVVAVVRRLLIFFRGTWPIC
jgi:hypothetical protein